MVVRKKVHAEDRHVFDKCIWVSGSRKLGNNPIRTGNNFLVREINFQFANFAWNSKPLQGAWQLTALHIRNLVAQRLPVQLVVVPKSVGNDAQGSAGIE